MSLLAGMHCNRPRPAAVAFYLAGASVIPLSGKAASVAWKRYAVTRPTMADITYWWPKNALNPRNVGIVCGRVSGGLLVVDLDGEGAVGAYHDAFPELCQTLTVRTGSGRGEHLYYYTDALPPSRRVGVAGGLIELRGDGLYVAAPPSIHPDTKQPYRVAGWTALEPLRVPDWSPVVAWLETFVKVETTPKAPGSLPTIKDSTRYGRSALLSEATRLAGQREGFRNNHLNTSAFRMGQLIARGHLTRAEVESTFLAVAAQVGMAEREAQLTIRSGMEAGISKAGHRG